MNIHHEFMDGFENYAVWKLFDAQIVWNGRRFIYYVSSLLLQRKCEASTLIDSLFYIINNIRSGILLLSSFLSNEKCN